MQLSNKLKAGVSLLASAIVYEIISECFQWIKEILGSRLSSTFFTPAQLAFIIIGIVGVILIAVDLWGKLYKKELDPRFEHVYAVLFYPEEISWARGERNPEKNMPRNKAVVNTKTKKSFWMLEYAIDLLKRGKIQYVTDNWKGEEEFKKWFESKGITSPKKHATESDLLAIVEPKESIEKPPKSTTDISIVKTRSLFSDRKLMEAYSPIHAMVVKINKKIPRESALQLTAGAWVNKSLMDFGIISAVFNQHNDKFRNRDLDIWFEIEEEIKARNGFFLGKNRQEWFDELEAEYNRLKSSIEDSASGSG